MYEKTFDTGGAQVIYLGDGSRTVFPVTFPAENTEELQLFIVAVGNGTGVIRALDQSEWSFNEATGNVTVVPASTPAEGEYLVIMRYTPIERRGSYNPGGPLTADSLNADLDRLTKICVDLDERLRRLGRHLLRASDELGWAESEQVPRGLIVRRFVSSGGSI